MAVLAGRARHVMAATALVLPHGKESPPVPRGHRARSVAPGRRTTVPRVHRAAPGGGSSVEAAGGASGGAWALLRGQAVRSRIPAFPEGGQAAGNHQLGKPVPHRRGSKSSTGGWLKPLLLQAACLAWLPAQARVGWYPVRMPLVWVVPFPGIPACTQANWNSKVTPQKLGECFPFPLPHSNTLEKNHPSGLPRWTKLLNMHE